MKNIAIIVAVDGNWGIGKNNDLLFNIPTDMKFFREKTTNQIVVYGLNTLNSFPGQKPLPNRINIVLSPITINKEGIITAHNIEELLEIIETLPDDKTVFICGGASVYRQMIMKNVCNEAYITKVHTVDEDADTFFPNIDDLENWEQVETSERILDEKSKLFITFTKYEKDTAIGSC